MDNLTITAGDFVVEKKGKLRDNYRIGKKIGESLFSSVRKITHRITGEVRTVKKIHKSNLQTYEENQNFFNEVNILRSIDHPNVIKLYEFYQDDKNYFLITEYCNGGELFNRIINTGHFSESIVANYIRQILSVASYCHERHIVHRDLNPENFLLDTIKTEANLKVFNFKTAQFFVPGVQMSQKIGSPHYIAPEVLRNDYDHLCDMWSVGVTLYILLCGFPPFGGKTDKEVLKRVSIGKFSYPSPEWDSISYEAKDLLSRMLTIDPSTRITANEALHHPWLSNANQVRLNSALSKSLYSNLRHFTTKKRLEKATFSFIISQLSTKQDKDEMLDLFISLDKDSSGTLSRSELIEGFSTVFGESVENVEEEVEKILVHVDINNNGEIDYSEFAVATMNRQKLLSREKLEAAFQAFDLDSNGTITTDELNELLGRYHSYDNSIWQDIIREVDTNCDGVVDINEFTYMMLDLLKND